MAKGMKRKYTSENSKQVFKKRRAAPYATPQKALKAETKYFDTATAVYALNTTGSVTHLDIVPTGSTTTTRDGRKWRNLSVQVRGRAAADTTTTISNGMAMVVWDRQPNKALAAVTDILDANTWESFPKRENAQRFKILKTWRWAFSGNVTTPSTGVENFDVNEYIKLPAECIAETTSADATGVIGNRITGALLLVTTGGTAAGTADANMTAYVRVNFRDL